jgi:hypothetical protein
MAVRRIVLDAESAASTQIINLEGVEYQLTTRWAETQRAWYADLYTADGRPLQVGRRLSLGSNPFLGLDGPPGAWVVAGDDSNSRTAFADGVQLLLYVPAGV